MNFTLGTLDYLLSKKHKIHHSEFWNSSQTIKHIHFFDQNSSDTDNLYLQLHYLNDPVSSDYSDNDLMVLHLFESENCATAEITSPQKRNYLCCPKGQLLSTAHTIFNTQTDYYFWFHEIKELSSSSRNLQQILELIAEFLGMNLWIVDIDFWIVADSSPEGKRIPNLASEQNSNDKLAELQTLFLNDLQLDSSFSLKGLQIYPNCELTPIFNPVYYFTPLYYYNLFYEDKYQGRFFAAAENIKDHPGLYTLLLGLGETITSCYAHFCETKLSGNHQTMLYRYFQELMLGKTIDPEKLGYAILSYGWQLDDQLRMIEFTPEQHAHSQQTLDYFCIQIESAFSNSLALQIGSNVLCIQNITSHETKKEFSKKIPYFLRDSLCKAGISNPFIQFEHCLLYAKQADDALRLGSRSHPDLWYFYFNDISRKYILEKICETYPATDLCHPIIKLLQDYDRSHTNSNLVDTLCQFLKCSGNASRAADALYIHRSTFLYRLQKIQQIMPINFDDWEEVFFLTLSFFLINRIR